MADPDRTDHPLITIPLHLTGLAGDPPGRVHRDLRQVLADVMRGPAPDSTPTASYDLAPHLPPPSLVDHGPEASERWLADAHVPSVWSRHPVRSAAAPAPDRLYDLGWSHSRGTQHLKSLVETFGRRSSDLHKWLDIQGKAARLPHIVLALQAPPTPVGPSPCAAALHTLCTVITPPSPNDFIRVTMASLHPHASSGRASDATRRWLPRVTDQSLQLLHAGAGLAALDVLIKAEAEVWTHLAKHNAKARSLAASTEWLDLLLAATETSWWVLGGPHMSPDTLEFWKRSLESKCSTDPFVRHTIAVFHQIVARITCDIPAEESPLIDAHLNDLARGRDSVLSTSPAPPTTSLRGPPPAGDCEADQHVADWEAAFQQGSRLLGGVDGAPAAEWRHTAAYVRLAARGYGRLGRQRAANLCVLMAVALEQRAFLEDQDDADAFDRWIADVASLRQAGEPAISDQLMSETLTLKAIHDATSRDEASHPLRVWGLDAVRRIAHLQSKRRARPPWPHDAPPPGRPDHIDGRATVAPFRPPFDPQASIDNVRTPPHRAARPTPTQARDPNPTPPALPAGRLGLFIAAAYDDVFSPLLSLMEVCCVSAGWFACLAGDMGAGDVFRDIVAAQQHADGFLHDLRRNRGYGPRNASRMNVAVEAGMTIAVTLVDASKTTTVLHSPTLALRDYMGDLDVSPPVDGLKVRPYASEYDLVDELKLIVGALRHDRVHLLKVRDHYDDLIRQKWWDALNSRRSTGDRPRPARFQWPLAERVVWLDDRLNKK